MRNEPVARRTTKVVTFAALFALALGALAMPASAHVNAGAEATDEGLVRIALSFSHGCEGEPTVGLRARIPEGATEVTAEDVEGWTSEVTDTQVAWTGGSIPDHQEAEFAFTARLTQAPGETVEVPTIQECETTQIDWVEPPTDDHSEASNPAPTFTVPEGAVPGSDGEVPAEGDEDPDAGEPAEDEEVTAISVPEDELTATADDQAASDDTEGANAGGNTGLVVFAIVVVVILGGGTILYLQNRGKGNATAADR